MKLIEFPQQTTIIAKNQPPYLPMPAFIADDDSTTTVVCWKLTWKERLLVLFNGIIWHRMLTFGNPMQPQRLEVASPFIK